MQRDEVIHEGRLDEVLARLTVSHRGAPSTPSNPMYNPYLREGHLDVRRSCYQGIRVLMLALFSAILLKLVFLCTWTMPLMWVGSTGTLKTLMAVLCGVLTYAVCVGLGYALWAFIHDHRSPLPRSWPMDNPYRGVSAT